MQHQQGIDPLQHTGPYTIVKLIERTESSKVFLAHRSSYTTPVAFKLYTQKVQDNEIELFMSHTEALSQLRHPHMVPILDFGIIDKQPYVVMEYMPHGSLRQRHPRGTQTPVETVVHYVQQVASALHYLHTQGLVHRDVKPHNVLLNAYDAAVLSDFGTAIQSYSLQPGKAPLPDFEGTVLYAPPEQLRGKPRCRSDQYALAVMAYELLCGDWPFHGSFHEVVHQHFFITPPLLKEKNCICPANIEQVLFRALSKDAGKRYATIKLFADELDWAYKVACARGDLATPVTTDQDMPAINPDLAVDTPPALPATTPQPLLSSPDEVLSPQNSWSGIGDIPPTQFFLTDSPSSEDGAKSIKPATQRQFKSPMNFLKRKTP